MGGGDQRRLLLIRTLVSILECNSWKVLQFMRFHLGGLSCFFLPLVHSWHGLARLSYTLPPMFYECMFVVV